jgi:hypothetical protein
LEHGEKPENIKADISEAGYWGMTIIKVAPKKSVSGLDGYGS